MLRYYYPLEFTTAFLNNARGDEDIAKGTKFAKEKGFTIKAPKFGYSQNEYVCDKETNTIYKGLESIKSMQTIAADIMKQIFENHPPTMLDVLYLCEEVKIDGKRINSKSMDILIDIGFFSQYGNVDTIKQIRHWFNQYGKCKTIKKDKVQEWEIPLIQTHVEKETDKQFSKIDNRGLIEEIISTLPTPPDDTPMLIRSQIEHLGYVDVEDADAPMDMYVVQGAHKDKWGRIWIDLFHIKSNQSFSYKCESKWYDKNPCEKNDLLKVVFRTKEKVKKVGEDENGKNIWQKSGEYENIISCYQIINEEMSINH